MSYQLLRVTVTVFALLGATNIERAVASCAGLPDTVAVREALRASVKPSGGAGNGGFDLPMWAALVDRDGIVCAVTYSGKERDDQWPGSRIIAAQKANTANAFSLNGLAVSTANLYSAVQPGGSLFGLQDSNPVNIQAAYGGEAVAFGTASDPMIGKRIGGINVFGGGLALYDKTGKIVGGLGVSGDSSCADHNVSWRVRKALDLAHVQHGVSANNDDGVIYDIVNGTSKSGWGHPKCAGQEGAVAVEMKAGVTP